MAIIHGGRAVEKVYCLSVNDKVTIIIAYSSSIDHSN